MHFWFRRGAGITLSSALIFVLLFALSLAAQSPNGSLQGEVADASGARVASARVTVTDAAISAQRSVQTNDRGEFRIDDLAPGNYRVVVHANGFAEATSDVKIVVASMRDVLVTLRPAAVEQSVNVHSQGSSITMQPFDTTRTVQQGIVTSQDLHDIPLAARSFANIAYMAPGTAPVEPSDPTKARITAVSFGGSSGLNVKLSVDGGDNTDDYIGGFLQNFSPDSIEEFSVQTSQEYADTGRTVGGSVVISTRRGTDEWHGNAAFYERAAALNARNTLDNPEPQPKQPFSRQNYIGAIGGPLKQGKLWLFSSFEYVHENASINYSPDNLDQFNALSSLAAQGLIPGVSSIPVPAYTLVPFNDYLGTIRLDWSQSARSQWFLRGAVDSYLTNNNLVQQGTLPSTGATTHSNYFNVVLNNTFAFTPTWLGSFTATASTLHNTQVRNSNLGFALAFPFSATSSTVSGFETFGDQQFQTPITAFPVLRNQEKYQFRYDVSHASGKHAPRFGIDFIHEPVLSGALSGTAENLTIFPMDPADYLTNPAQFSEDLVCGENATPGTTCNNVPAGNGSFSQNVQRLGLYVHDSWRVTRSLTVNYGIRWDTSFGLFQASGRNQYANPAYSTLKALQVPLVNGIPQDYRKAFAPRLGIAWSPGKENLVIRAGVGIYWNDLAQNGWVTAFQAVNEPPVPCAQPGDPGCLPGASAGGAGSLIDPNYHTPYALHASAGVHYAFTPNWTLSADYIRETGMHAYRAYNYVPGYSLFSPLYPSDPVSQQDNVPNIQLYKTDNRSSYNALAIHLQGNMARWFNLTANYTLASAKTWGCTVGELFDYVNGVCNALNPFGPGDYGPSGEDVRNRFVLVGVFNLPAKFQLSTLMQFESARPLTLTTPVDVNGTGDTSQNRAVINGVMTSLDQFRGTPYMQVDLKVARPFQVSERWTILPFIEFFNLFNRTNPGNNYITDISALPNPVNDLYNATQVCGPNGCVPIVSQKQYLYPAGALGDFFGPGTTVGIPFAAQIGVRVTF
ncbi:MAG TPA: carboxypeptidase regulatory-like domain-containing protein [Candidatus Methylomirabilis sp.]|nr:carboxypeptidase regulatory-like domain-containing protein [Candidatus Methylomirabilis sp.]